MGFPTIQGHAAQVACTEAEETGPGSPPKCAAARTFAFAISKAPGASASGEEALAAAQTCEAVAASKRRMAFARHRTDLTSLQKATFRLPQDCGCGAQLDTGRAGPDQRHGERDRSPCLKTDAQLLLWNDTPHEHLIGCEADLGERRAGPPVVCSGRRSSQRPERDAALHRRRGAYLRNRQVIFFPPTGAHGRRFNACIALIEQSCGFTQRFMCCGIYLPIERGNKPRALQKVTGHCARELTRSSFVCHPVCADEDAGRRHRDGRE